MRWRRGIHIIMEKKRHNSKVNKWRTILLYEVDFNRNNKTLGRELIWVTEFIKIIAQE